MNKLPVELEEDIISRVRSYRGVYKLSLMNRASRRQLIQIGRDLAREYMAEVGVHVALPQTESLRDIQILLWKLIIRYQSDGQVRQSILKYCTVQYPKPQSISKLRRFARSVSETYINTEYLEDSEFAHKFEKIVERFKDRNQRLSAGEQVYLFREIVSAYDKFETEEYVHARLVKLVHILAQNALIPLVMLQQILS
jgi:hypothetical protein